MTSDEIKKTLKDVLILSKTMDREHLKKLLQILCLVLRKQEPESSYARELRKDIKKAIDICTETDQLEFLFTHRHIKEIYKIMGDYEWFPVCKLCGEPIRIDSGNHRHSVHYTPGEFSWDHIVPKSMGGLKELANLQPTHKLCNNLRGNLTQLENEHYVINITVNFISINNTKNKKNRRKAKQNLKQQVRKHYHRHNNHCPCCGR